MQGISIRPFQSGDKKVCLELYNSVHPEEMTQENWNWRNLQGPYGAALIQTAWDSGRLVGTYGLIPIMLFGAGKMIRGALSDIAVTHPEYRYRGIFSSLGKSLYNRAIEKGIKIIYGFPTEHSIHGFQGRLGWDYVFKSRAMVMSSRLAAEIKLKSDINILGVKQVGEEFDILWERLIRGTFRRYYTVARHKDYILWRFRKKSGKSYQIYLAEERPGVPSGYMVVRQLAENGEVFSDIEDIASVDVNSFRSLIAFAATGLTDYTAIRLFLTEGNPFYQCALGMGFKEGGKKYNFGGRLLDSAAISWRDWYYTAGDAFWDIS
ncbi:MAG: GNAT family N-acetyltransferase [Desulfocucumaceae bacterium]